MQLKKCFAGSAVTAVTAVMLVPSMSVSADTIIKTVQNGHLTEWAAGYNAAEYEVNKVQLNGYSVDGMGKFQLQAADGTTLDVWCIQADVGHSTTANYQLTANTVSSGQLDYLSFIGRETSDDATATAIQAVIWALVNAVRSGGGAVPVWYNTVADAPIAPDSPDSWTSLPAYSTFGYPVGLRLSTSAGTIDLDGAEALAAQLWTDANLLEGPWTIAAPLEVPLGSGTYQTQITSVWNVGVPGRTVTFTLPGGATMSALTDANGYATISPGPVSGTLQVDASAPGTHVEFAASGVQRLLAAGTPTNIRNAATLAENPSLTSTASDATDGDQIVAVDGAISDSVPITKLTIGSSYLLRGQLYDVEATAIVGAEVSVAFTAIASAETHGLLSAPVPASAAGHRLVWILNLDDVTAAHPSVAVSRDPANVDETVMVAPVLSITTDAGASLTVQRGQSAVLSDQVTLAGLAAAFRSTAAESGSGTATLYGPYPSAAAATCAAAEAVGAVPISFVADGTVTSAAVSVTPLTYDTFYSWVATVTTSQGRTITHGCGLPAETPAVISDVSAEVHLRKTVSSDGATWHNAQKETTPAYTPVVAPPDPRSGSHDDGVADAGDAIPVYPAGAKISFQYQVWLDASSTGWAAWTDGTTGVVSDDNGTPDDTSDDFTPSYLSGDNGDGLLEPGETWLYEAKDKLTAKAGAVYRNYSAIGAGRVVDGSDTERPTGKTTTPRKDPAGYVVPSCHTTAINRADQTHLVGVAGGTITDTVACTNLVPGVALAVSGELQTRQPDGTVIASGIIGSSAFTPAAANSSVDVTFTIPATAKPGTYVVFETVNEPTSGKVVAVHKDAGDADQTVLKRRPITITTSACHTERELGSALTTGNCDLIVVGGDPDDVVSGTTWAVPVVGGVRRCDAPSAPVAWSVTIDADGESAVTTGDVIGLTQGGWEFLHEARTADGRSNVRDCATASRVESEAFDVTGGGAGGGQLPTTGSDPMETVLLAVAAVVVGGLFWVVALRRRRRLIG